MRFPLIEGKKKPIISTPLLPFQEAGNMRFRLLKFALSHLTNNEQIG